MEWNAPGATGKRVVRQSMVPGARADRTCLLLPTPEALAGSLYCTRTGTAIQLAEVPTAPKSEETHAKLRLTTKTGTLEIMDADQSVLDQVLRAMLHAE